MNASHFIVTLYSFGSEEPGNESCDNLSVIKVNYKAIKFKQSL